MLFTSFFQLHTFRCQVRSVRPPIWAGPGWITLFVYLDKIVSCGFLTQAIATQFVCFRLTVRPPIWVGPDCISMETLPDAESLPSDGEADSLPRSDESEPEVVSAVVPVPGEMSDEDDQQDDLPGNDDLPGTCCVRNCNHCIQTE